MSNDTGALNSDEMGFKVKCVLITGFKVNSD